LLLSTSWVCTVCNTNTALSGVENQIAEKLNAVGGAIRNQPTAGRAVASRDVIVLNDGSIGIPEIDRVFLLLRVEIQSRVCTGERVVIFQRHTAASGPKPALPALKVLPSESVRRVISRVQQEVSRNGHVRGILNLDIRFSISDHIALDGEVPRAVVAKNAVIVITAGRRLCLGMDIAVINLDTVTAADVDPIPSAGADL